MGTLDTIAGPIGQLIKGADPGGGRHNGALSTGEPGSLVGT